MTQKISPKYGLRNVVCFGFFMAVVYLPMVYSGLTHTRVAFMPSFFKQLQDIAFLFSGSMKYLAVPYVQARFEPGGEWETLPMEEEYFRMPSFGYRSRLTRYMEIYQDRKYHKKAGSELAQWVRLRYLKLHPDGKKPVAVRLLWGLFEVGKTDSFRVWKKPDPASYPPGYLQVLYTEDFSAGESAA